MRTLTLIAAALGATAAHAGRLPIAFSEYVFAIPEDGTEFTFAIENDGGLIESPTLTWPLEKGDGWTWTEENSPGFPALVADWTDGAREPTTHWAGGNAFNVLEYEWTRVTLSEFDWRGYTIGGARAYVTDVFDLPSINEFEVAFTLLAPEPSGAALALFALALFACAVGAAGRPRSR